jgi:hypothetical protein
LLLYYQLFSIYEVAGKFGAVLILLFDKIHSAAAENSPCGPRFDQHIHSQSQLAVLGQSGSFGGAAGRFGLFRNGFDAFNKLLDATSDLLQAQPRRPRDSYVELSGFCARVLSVETSKRLAANRIVFPIRVYFNFLWINCQIIAFIWDSQVQTFSHPEGRSFRSI